MIDLKLEFSEQFLVFTLREFNSFLIKEGYFIKDVVFNGIKDDGESIYYESHLNHKTGLEIALRHSSLLSRRLYFTFSRPRKKILGMIGERESISVDIVTKEIGNMPDTSEPVTENNLLITLQAYKKFIQQHLLPVIKGEIWMDELLKKKRK